MKALVFGVTPDPYEAPAGGNKLLENLAVTPVALQDIDEPRPSRPDWVVTRPLPHRHLRLGLQADPARLRRGRQRQRDERLLLVPPGDGARGGRRGRRARARGARASRSASGSCSTRGCRAGRAASHPICPACEAGDFSLCWSFTDGRARAGHPHRRVERRDRRLRRADARAHIDAVPGARRASPTSTRCSPTRSRCRCTRSPAIRRPPAARCSCRARARSARARSRSSARSTPTSRWRWSPASTPRRSSRRSSARHRSCGPASSWRSSRSWPRGRAARLRPTMEGLAGLPMCHPGGIDVVYDTVGKPETFEVGVRVLKARGTLVKSGVHAPGRWEWSPLYFKEITWVGSNAFGIEEVDGVRQHGIQPLPRPGRRRPGRPHGHAHPHLPARPSGATRSSRSPTRATPAPSRSPSTTDERADAEPVTVADDLSGLGSATLGEIRAPSAMSPRIRAAWPGARLAAPAFTVQCPPGDNLAIHVGVAAAPAG